MFFCMSHVCVKDRALMLYCSCVGYCKLPLGTWPLHGTFSMFGATLRVFFFACACCMANFHASGSSNKRLHILGNVVDMPSQATFLNDVLEQMQGMTSRSLYFGLWMPVVTLKLSFPHVFPESCLDPGMSHVPRFLQAKRSELCKILF